MNYGIILYLKNGQSHSLEMPDDLKIKEDETLIEFQTRVKHFLVMETSNSGYLEFKLPTGTLVFKSETIDGFYVGEVAVAKE